MTRSATPAALGVFLIAIGLAAASAGALGAAGILQLSSLGAPQPDISLGVYTSVAPGSTNVLTVTLLNVADPGGEIVLVSIDGGADITLITTALNTAPAAPAGRAQLTFNSGNVGYHTIAARWSNGTHSAEGTIGYTVVGSQPTNDYISNAEGSPLSIILMAAGGITAVAGAVLLAWRRLA